eukprot:1159144-Pelagomonas_calceolata.AAC.8
MGILQSTPFRQVYLQVCSSDIADTIAKERGSNGGLAGSGWARTSGGVGGSLSPHLCNKLGSNSLKPISNSSIYNICSIIVRHMCRFGVEIPRLYQLLSQTLTRHRSPLVTGTKMKSSANKALPMH